MKLQGHQERQFSQVQNFVFSQKLVSVEKKNGIRQIGICMKKFHSFLSLYPLTGPKVSFLPLFVVHLLSLKFHFFPLCSPFTGPKVSFFPHFIVHLLIICLCVVSSTLKGWPCLGVRVEEEVGRVHIQLGGCILADQHAFGWNTSLIPKQLLDKEDLKLNLI